MSIDVKTGKKSRRRPDGLASEVDYQNGFPSDIPEGLPTELRCTYYGLSQGNPDIPYISL